MLSPRRKCPGRKGYPGSKVLVCPLLPIARYPGLSLLVTFCTWPTILALLTSIELPITTQTVVKHTSSCKKIGAEHNFCNLQVMHA